jgi:serine/threonine protein kinase
VRYELLERIGGGGSGDLHVARVVGGLDRRVCVKRLAGAVSAQEALALREEGRLLASVRHANVVSVLGFAEDEQLGPFLVMELVEGMDLHTLTRRLAPDRLADGVAVHVACDLLRALAAVQQYLPGLVHRDVTPHNVLVSMHGEVKLADFGIALARSRTPREPPSTVKGKLGYMAPEQLRGEELDVRTDLFAVGIVLYEMLAGVRPWAPARGTGELRCMLEAAPVSLASRRRSAPRGLDAAVARLIAPAPADRFSGPEDALRALALFGAGELGSLRLASLVSRARGGVT